MVALLYSVSSWTYLCILALMLKEEPESNMVLLEMLYDAGRHRGKRLVLVGLVFVCLRVTDGLSDLSFAASYGVSASTVNKMYENTHLFGEVLFNRRGNQ